MPNRPAASGATTARGEEIIAAATRLFASGGYRATSLNDVADAVGISKSTLYHYFSGKEEILYLINRRIIDLGLDMARAATSQGGSAAEQMRSTIRGHISLVLANVEANMVVTAGRRDLSAEQSRDIRARQKAYEQILRDVYEQGVRDRSLRDVDARFAVTTLLSACNWLYRWMGDPDDVDVAAALEDLVTGGFFLDSPDADEYTGLDLATGSYADARAAIGRTTGEVRAEAIVEKSRIDMYCAAVEDPRWWDTDQAPPGMLMAWQMPAVPWRPDRPVRNPMFAHSIPGPGNDVINVSTDTEYFAPITVGNQLTIEESLETVSPPKDTALGRGLFLTTLTTFRNEDGAVVARNRNVMFRFERTT